MRNLSVALLATALLAACGGGGGGSDDDTPNTAAGIWDGDDFALLVTPGGELWGAEADGSDLILYKGEADTNGSNFSAKFNAYYMGRRISATAAGTFTPQGSINGTATVPDVGSSSFTVRYSSAYDRAATTAAIAGTYRANTGGTVTIAGTGAFSGTVDGCPLTGTATPDASGKNYYRVSVTFANSAGCALPGGSAEGVAAPAAGGSLLVGVVNGNLGQAILLMK